MRLIAEPAKRARNPASSSAAKLGERRCDPVRARAELGMRRSAREAVPRADGEAVVAAIDAVAEFFPQLVRNRPFVLDGQVGNAARGIEPIGRREGIGRAHRQAARTGAAAVGVRRIGRDLRASCRSSPRNSQEPKRRDTRFVCLPCQPIPARCASGFSITGAVSTNTFTSSPEARGDELRQVLQHALDHVVVVAVAGIDRDRATVRPGERRQRVGLRRVAQPERDDAARLRPKRLWMGPLLGPRRHPAHIAVLSGRQERLQPFPGLRPQLRRGEPDRIEAERQRLVANCLSRETKRSPPESKCERSERYRCPNGEIVFVFVNCIRNTPKYYAGRIKD